VAGCGRWYRGRVSSNSSDAELPTADNKPLILVCDDDVMVRMLARECLEAEGMAVCEAADGADALQAYAEHKPDLLFLDVDMPLVSGIDVCEQIRAQPGGTTVPILIATGADDRDTIDRGFNAGATQYKTKPINWSLLGRDIRYMLRAAQAFNDLKAQEDRLRHLAYYDHLTALPNRRSFIDQLQRGFADKAGTRSLGLIMINIDHFKRINDSIGHERGDDLLCRFAARLSTFVREAEHTYGRRDGDHQAPSMMLARQGGDEFALIIRNPDGIDQLIDISASVLNMLSEPVAIQGHTLIVTPSLGIASYPEHSDSPEQLMRRADVAMRAVKKEGGRSARVFDDSLEDDYEKQLLIEEGLREALENDGLSMAYQPQIDVKTGKVSGAEALVRWQNKHGEWISPATFIPVAERSGLISPIGDWILRRVHRDAKFAAGKFPPNIAISINLSPLQFSQSNFVEHVTETLRQLELGYDIELELTEGVIMSDAESNLSKLRQLKNLGFKLAIDDFGTGYSSLSYLRHFPIDTLKIDRSFVTDIGRADGEGIVRAILGLCKELNLKSVAEGVETKEQADFLRRHGCDTLQGFLLARPTSVDGLIAATQQNYSHLIEAP
jgi:diguanylate cyclase (GGDEF)-like protein